MDILLHCVYTFYQPEYVVWIIMWLTSWGQTTLKITKFLVIFVSTQKFCAISAQLLLIHACIRRWLMRTKHAQTLSLLKVINWQTPSDYWILLSNGRRRIHPVVYRLRSVACACKIWCDRSCQLRRLILMTTLGCNLLRVCFLWRRSSGNSQTDVSYLLCVCNLIYLLAVITTQVSLRKGYWINKLCRSLCRVCEPSDRGTSVYSRESVSGIDHCSI